MEKKFPIFKILTLLVWLVLGMGTAFAAAPKCAANTTWGGFKTVIATQNVDGVYEIDSPEKLAWFACEITKTGTASVALNAKLTQSIDLQGKLFIPISAGKGTPSYGGTFDGQGYTIKNLFIKGSEIVKTENGGKDVYAQNIGLFAVLKGGTVKNVTLTNVEIYAASSAGDVGTSGKDNPISVGAIAGFVEAGTISGCAASGKIETSGATNRVGGIAGNVWAATISNCISEVNIYATGDNTHVGGIVGVVRDKTGEVTLNSCVYAGETLFSNNGSAGAVAGQYEKKEDITSNDLYYTSDYPAVGTGLGNRPFDSKPVEDLNTEDVICELNGGTWNTDDQTCSEASANVICELNGGSWNTNEGTCSNASADGAWSEGQSNLSINGSDGFKVTFDANGGSFSEGSKTSKFFAKGATITANEIANPTYTGYKFAGWSLTQGGDVQNLGKADKAKTVYAVWKPIHTITFKTIPGTFVGGSSEESKNVAEGDVVTVEGLPALPVRFCSQETNGNCDKYAYFNGWSTVSHAPYGEKETIPEGTIVDLPTFEFSDDVTLYAVWIESETYTVTFNANQHGQTKVAFVKVGKNEKTVQPPDPDANEGYVFTGRWCEEIPCDDDTKFDFNTEIKRNYVLYADWSVSEYDIFYIIDGVPNTETGNQAKYNVESDPITLVKPDSAGYVFDGWYDEDGNEATTILSRSTGDKTFRGSWVPVSYTITYLADNTLSLTTISDVKLHGVAKELKGATFAHGGCTQDGWSKVSYGKDGYNFDFAVNGSYEEDKDVILFPHWNCGTFTITYEMFDVPGAENYSTNPSEYTGPAAITLANANDTHNPKRFFMDNWYKESTFKTVIRDIQNIDADLTVYAKWYNKITYKPGARLKAVNSKLKDVVDKKYFDSTYTFKSSVANFELAGFALDGWSTTDNGEKVYELGVIYNANENVTLYPHWVDYLTVTRYGAVTINDYGNNHKEAVIYGNYGAKEKTDERDAVAIPDDIEVSRVVMSRIFPKGVYSTIVLPFSVNTQNVEGLKAVLYYNGIKTENNKSTIRMKVLWAADGVIKDKNNQPVYYQHTDMLANTPYMLLMNDETFAIKSEAYPITLKETTAAKEDADGSGWTFRGTWQYKEWGASGVDPETGYAYGFSAATAGSDDNKINVGDFVRAGAGAWIRPMRAYLVKTTVMAALARANGAYVKRPSVVQEELPEIMSIVIDNGRDDEGQTTVIGHFNTRTGEIKMIPQQNRTFDVKGRNVGNKANKARGAYYGKKVKK
jgi:uncharacterized repeat protein (TIGR02543 family)